jgi:hypothetical protein
MKRKEKKTGESKEKKGTPTGLTATEIPSYSTGRLALLDCSTKSELTSC